MRQTVKYLGLSLALAGEGSGHLNSIESKEVRCPV